MLKTDYVQYFRSHKVNDLQNGSPSYKATSQFTYSLLFLYKIPHAKKIGHNARGFGGLLSTIARKQDMFHRKGR